MSKLFSDEQIEQFWRGYVQSDLSDIVLKIVAGLRAMEKPEPEEQESETFRALAEHGRKNIKPPFPPEQEEPEMMICENAEKCMDVPEEKPEIKGPPQVGDVVESRSGRIMNVVAVRKDEAWIQNEDYRDMTYIHNLRIISRPGPQVGDVFEWEDGYVRKCFSVIDGLVTCAEYTTRVRDFASMLNSGEIKRIYRSEK